MAREKAEKKEKSTILDLTSTLGLPLGIALIVFGIIIQMPDPEKGIPFALLWGQLINFWDISSVLIVFGGTIAALMVSYPINYFAKIPHHLKIILFPTKFNAPEYIREIVELAKTARGEGILALQDKVEDIQDNFFRNSLNLVIDAVDAEKVKVLMETELDYLDERHAQDRAFYARGSAYAPAFGMIGTLIGLVNLLQSLSDPDAIAPAMSVALVTTFYGSILSNLIFAPISNKLKVRHDEEYLCKMIVCEGVQAIQAGDSPRFIEDKLTQLLPGKLAQEAADLRDDKKGRKGKKDKDEK